MAFFSSSLYAQILNIDPHSVEAQAWIIYDPQSQQIIDQYQSNVQRAPASLTKMMTAYLTLQAIKNGKLKSEQIITTPDIVNLVADDESQLHLKPNEKITIDELLAGLIIISANDAALTLATEISGDVTNFVQLMNQTAKKLGMTQTHFSNPSGITMPQHYSSARDMAILAEAIVNDTPVYLHYSKQPSLSYKNTQYPATNLLLNQDNSVDGMKTGHTQAAGYNLVATANRLDKKNNTYRRLIVVVLGTASKAKRAEVADRLLNIAFQYTQTNHHQSPHQLIAEIPVKNGFDHSYKIYSPQIMPVYTASLLPKQQSLNAQQFDLKQQYFILENKTVLYPTPSPSHIEYKIQLTQQQFIAPINQSLQHVANIHVQQFNQTIQTIAIKQDIHLPPKTWWQKIIDWLKDLLGWTQDTSAKEYPLH